MEPLPLYEVEFARHPLAINARVRRKYSTIARNALLCVVALFAWAMWERGQKQNAVILLPSGQMAVGQFSDLTATSPLLAQLASHYAEQLLTWDWRYADGHVRASHLAEFASQQGAGQVQRLRDDLREKLSKAHVDQQVNVSGVSVRKVRRDYVATVRGTITTGTKISARTYVDEFVLTMTLMSTFDAELSEDEPGLLASLFSRSKDNSVASEYPFIIKQFTLQQENIK